MNINERFKKMITSQHFTHTELTFYDVRELNKKNGIMSFFGKTEENGGERLISIDQANIIYSEIDPLEKYNEYKIVEEQS